ncbi:MAG: serine/threonine protein phosphatase [Spirochaetaceae bacterium]|jgi:predicted phosphodiesterase|nr:serine/threonine protein phosphatase [Spirochaetaceae bacterium]
MLYFIQMNTVSPFFADIMSPRFNSDAVLDLSQGGRVLIISDFHMGDGGRADDLSRNGPLVCDLLERYYYPQGWYLILNGDIEELQRYNLEKIRARWHRLYEIFSLFSSAGRLYKTLGNHDEALVFEKDYPYALYNAVRIETGVVPVFVYHGHQSSKVYSGYNHVIRLLLRYIVKPFGIKNISSARSPHRRFHVEREAYTFSLAHNCISVIGHTHRPLFESLGRFDYIKFEIERLCRDYPGLPGEQQRRIADEIRTLRFEMAKLKRSERRSVLRQSLYGDDMAVPCLFNSGSAIGKKGINAIELDSGSIALVYWFTEGEGKNFVSRGGYQVDKLSGGGRMRAVLNRDTLEFIKAKIDLLGR